MLLLICALMATSAYFTIRFRRLVNLPSLFLMPLCISLLIAVALDFLSAQEDVSSCVINMVYCHYFSGNLTRLVIFYFTGAFGFIIPWVYQFKKGDNYTIRSQSFFREAPLSLFITMFLTLFSLGLTIYLLGYFPLFEMLKSNMDISQHIGNLEKLPMGLMTINLILAFSLIIKWLLMNNAQVSWPLKACFFTTLFLVCFWQGNRQIFAYYLMLVFFIKLIRLESSKSKTAKKDYLLFLMGSLGTFIAFYFVFVFVNYVRLPKGGASPFNELLMYLAWPQFNLVSLLNKLSNYPQAGHIHYLLANILPARSGGKELWHSLHAFLFEPSAPIGYLSYWFLDFGFIGVFLGGAVLGCVAKYVDLKRNNSLFANEIYLLTIYVLTTSFLYPHLISLTYFWGVVIYLFFSNLISRKLHNLT